MTILAKEHPLVGTAIATGTRELFAGAIGSVLSIAYGLSFGALIFSGPLTPWLAYGIAATFLTSSVSACVMAMRSSLPFAIAGPDSATSAVTATLVAASLSRLAGVSSGEDMLQRTLIVMAIGAMLTGLLLCGLGLTRLGRAIRFVPYPVVGGFLGATGWLMVSGAVRVTTDDTLTVTNIRRLLGGAPLAQLLVAAAVAITLSLCLRRSRSGVVLAAVLAAFLLAAHAGFFLTATSLAQAQADGWVFKPLTAVTVTMPWNLEELGRFPWRMLPSLSGEIVAVMFVTTISMLLNTTGIEFATRREANLERELTGLGIANLVSAALGGYVNCTSLSRTTLIYSAGGRGRLSGLTVAAISAGILFAGPGFVAYVPKFVLGGILVYLGGSLMFRWLVESARRLSRLEYFSLLAIVLIIVQWGFIPGVLIGIVIGCATFALNATRVNAIKFSFDGSEIRSSLDRGTDELALLAKHGSELQAMTLQSYLFFGSANRLYQHVKILLARHSGCRFLIFDFRLVTGLDSSAMHSFTQIKQAANEIGAQLVLVHLSPEVEHVFRSSRFIDTAVIMAADIDRALETCENAIVAAHRDAGLEARTLMDWLASALGSADHAQELLKICNRQDVDAGDTIANQGEAADSMHFILDGRVAILVGTEEGRAIRVRSLGPHTTIGEMGLITNQPRSATIQAEIASVLYSLSNTAYRRITVENPALAQALLNYVISVMSERLTYASRVISVLRR